MDKSSKFWRVAAAAFVVINAGGAIYAIVMGEGMHAMVHGGLLVGGFAAWQVFTRKESVEPAQAQMEETRLDSLQESIDSIALNVERMGEAQRFHEKLLKERAEKPLNRSS
jgi:hypothetical protein